jgi:carbon-monoxide dehydrogenase medium subunit
VFPADFAYVRAESLEHALALLAGDNGDNADGASDPGDTDIKVLAGGMSLLPMMKLRLAVPEVVLDIGGLEELAAIQADGARTRIGALATYRKLQLDPLVKARFPAMTDALAVLADPQVRARGTIGGSVAHGDPASDLPAVLLAMDAELTVARRASTRTVKIDDFLQGIFTTDLSEDELLTEITLPGMPPGQAYEKFEQPASHLPLAGVCAVVETAGGVIAAARIAVTGVAGRPFRARAAEQALTGARLDGSAAASTAQLAAAAEQVADGVDPLADQHATGPFRLHLAEILTRRAVTRALARAASTTEGGS